MARRGGRLAALAGALVFLAAADAQADRPAELMPLAPKSLLLDVALAGDRAVAVGERGHILLSDDYGRSWRQVATPTRTTLTAVYFADPQHGWAVGHENVILATADGGQTWTQQFAQGTIEERYLDVHFLNARRGFAVGAYGFARATGDSGKSWEPAEIFDEELHFNRMSRGPDGRLYLALEAGELLTSGDDGATWDILPSPYEGSLFGVLPLGARTLLTYGLRGHVYRSTDAGDSWVAVETPVQVLIMHAIRMSTGQVILAGQNRQFLVSHDGGRSFSLWQVPVQGATALAECPDGTVLAVGMNGAHRLIPPTSSAQEEAP